MIRHSPIERANSHKTIANDFTAQASGTVVEGQSIEDDLKALSDQASQPDIDVEAVATKGRAVALRVMKHFGSWRQEAAAQALAGTDEDVLKYLRTGWQQAQQDEIRLQVSDLASNSPYASVRTSASEALTGTDQQIRDFYTTGRHESGLADYRVLVSQIHNTGGPGVKETAEAALADGSAQALLSFLNSGQHTARNADERVAASQLVNTGGPEVKAEAKVALSGPADQLHDFISTGQFMAERRDRLADAHIAQVQRLIAEGGIIAAKAQQNRWLAAQAAAEANQASAEADQAALQAQQSADLAARYAVDADTAADSAETSASKAAESATAARNAATRAQNDLLAAEESAAQAEFSANYARASAAIASEAASEARESALAAGKSAEEAKTAASQAWDRAVKLREAEEAAARRAAEEQRKQERERDSKPPCYLHATRDSLPICALAGQPIESPPIDPTLKEIVWAVTGLNDAKDCIKDPSLGKCAMLAMVILPVGKVKSLKNGAEALEDAVQASRLRNFPGVTADAKLLDEMAANGIKFSRDDVIATARAADGRIIFLEIGNSRAGLRHVMKHGDEFISAGIPEDEIPSFVIKAVTGGKIVGHQGSGTGRPIYELVYNGKTHRVAVTTGNNGFIVGANMRGSG